MTRYYDQKTVQCRDCMFYQPGEYPNGVPYMACRAYGYILHDDKPATDEPCDKFVSEADAESKRLDAMRARSIRQLGKANKK